MTEERVGDESVQPLTDEVDGREERSSGPSQETVGREVHDLGETEEGSPLPSELARPEPALFAELQDSLLREPPVVRRMGMEEPDVGNGEEERSPGLQDSPHLPECLDRPRHVLQHLGAEDEVEHGIRQARPLGRTEVVRPGLLANVQGLHPIAERLQLLAVGAPVGAEIQSSGPGRRGPEGLEEVRHVRAQGAEGQVVVLRERRSYPIPRVMARTLALLRTMERLAQTLEREPHGRLASIAASSEVRRLIDERIVPAMKHIALSMVRPTESTASGRRKT